jgi:D-aspartate ligase
VLGTGITALGVMRSLSRRGIAVYCASDNLGFVTKSRWYRRPDSSIEKLSDPQELPGFLDSLPYKRFVLMPCADNWTAAVANLPQQYHERALVSLPSRECLEMLVDKGEFADLLVRLEIPHPTTLLLDTEDQLNNIDSATFEGSFIKPRDSQAFFKHYQVKACRLESREHAVEQFRHKSSDGFRVMFQEYIPGSADNHYFIDGFVDRLGNIAGMFARRRLRMFPVDFGNSTYMISVPVADVQSAADSLSRLLASIPFRGIFSAEFKYDSRDAQFKILEINARPWWFVEFASVCGVDVCNMAYRDALDLDVEPVDGYRVGTRFVHPYYDVNICMKLLKSRELSLYSWMRSWIGARYPVFCVDDPLPAISWMSKRALKRAAKVLGLRSEPLSRASGNLK